MSGKTVIRNWHYDRDGGMMISEWDVPPSGWMLADGWPRPTPASGSRWPDRRIRRRAKQLWRWTKRSLPPDRLPECGRDVLPKRRRFYLQSKQRKRYQLKNKLYIKQIHPTTTINYMHISIYCNQMGRGMRCNFFAMVFGQLEIICGESLGDLWGSFLEILERCQSWNGCADAKVVGVEP